MKNIVNMLFNINKGLFKKAREGKPSGIIFTLILPIIVQLLIIPILFIPMIFFGIFILKGQSFVIENSFALNLILTTGAVILLYFLIVKFKEKRSIKSMGFAFNKDAIFQYIRGFLIGILMIGIIAIVIVITGNGEFIINKNIDISFLIPFILIIIGWIVQGASEEIMMRGHMLPVLGVRVGPKFAIIVSSAYFGLLHLGNNGISPLSIVNLILFGMFAAIYALFEDGLWGVCAIHSAWNFAQGNIFGFLVSGINAEGGTIIRTRILEDNIINGGTFGPEGGIITTIILLIGIGIGIYLTYRKNNLENI